MLILIFKPPVYIYSIYTMWLIQGKRMVRQKKWRISEALNELLFVFPHVSAETVCSRSYSQTLLWGHRVTQDWCCSCASAPQGHVSTLAILPSERHGVWCSAATPDLQREKDFTSMHDCIHVYSLCIELVSLHLFKPSSQYQQNEATAPGDLSDTDCCWQHVDVSGDMTELRNAQLYTLLGVTTVWVEWSVRYCTVVRLQDREVNHSAYVV